MTAKKFEQANYSLGHAMEVGWVKIDNFQLISHYISEIVETGTQLLWKANKNSYEL